MLLGSFIYTRKCWCTIVLLIHVDTHDCAGLDALTRHFSIQESLLLACCQVELQLIVNDETSYGFDVIKGSFDSCNDCMDTLEGLLCQQHQLNMSTNLLYLGESRACLVDGSRLRASLRLTVTMVGVQSLISRI